MQSLCGRLQGLGFQGVSVLECFLTRFLRITHNGLHSVSHKLHSMSEDSWTLSRALEFNKSESEYQHCYQRWNCHCHLDWRDYRKRPYAGAVSYVSNSKRLCVISGFLRCLSEVCVFWDFAQNAWHLKLGPINCPETAVTNYHNTLLKIP